MDDIFLRVRHPRKRKTKKPLAKKIRLSEIKSKTSMTTIRGDKNPNGSSSQRGHSGQHSHHDITSSSDHPTANIRTRQ